MGEVEVCGEAGNTSNGLATRGWRRSRTRYRGRDLRHIAGPATSQRGMMARNVRENGDTFLVNLTSRRGSIPRTGPGIASCGIPRRCHAGKWVAAPAPRQARWMARSPVVGPRYNMRACQRHGARAAASRYRTVGRSCRRIRDRCHARRSSGLPKCRNHRDRVVPVRPTGAADPSTPGRSTRCVP